MTENEELINLIIKKLITYSIRYLNFKNDIYFYELVFFKSNYMNKTICRFQGHHIICVNFIKRMSEVGFEPTPSLEDQNLSLAP